MTGTPTAECPGCVGRGTGANCCMCGGPIPAHLRRTRNSGPEWSPTGDDCANGRIHTHEGPGDCYAGPESPSVGRGTGPRA